MENKAVNVYHIVSITSGSLGTGILLNLCQKHFIEYIAPKGCILVGLDNEPTGDCEVCSPATEATTS